MNAAWPLLLILWVLGAPASAQPVGAPFKDCAECPELVVLPEGAVVKGRKPATPTDPASPSPGAIAIKPFAIGRFEVTQAQWFVVMSDRPSEYIGDDLPVETVSWIDVQDFLQKLSAKTGRHYRLPTSDEWEYAAKAGSDADYSFGDQAAGLGAYAWFLDNADETTHPVGRKLPNAFGLYDIHGNVWEWTQDCTIETLKDGPNAAVAKFLRDCHRIYRGGSMANKASSLKTVFTQSSGVGDRYFGLGLRVVRSLP